MTYVWTINDIEAENEQITKVYYTCTFTDDDFKVETEGWWDIRPRIPMPVFKEITHNNVCVWVEEDSTQNGVNIIKSRLAEQLENLKKEKVKMPWLPAETFKVSL